MKDDEMLKYASIIKLALRVEGIHVVDNPEGIGTEIKEDIMGLYKMDNVTGHKLVELGLYDDIMTKVIHNVQSPFELRRSDDNFYVSHRGRRLIDVSFTPRPEHYGMLTSKGTPMKFVAQEVGTDCLGITLDKRCFYFTNGSFCRYCNIDPTNIESGIARVSDLEDVSEVVRAVGRKYRFIDVTGGAFADRDIECREYTRLGNVIRDALGMGRWGAPISLSPPNNPELLHGLFDTGANVVTFNRDVYSDEANRVITPAKFAIGKKHYDVILEEARKIWGTSNAIVQYMIGNWETNDELLDGVKYHLDRGILVNLTTFVPSPKSTFARSPPKTLKDLLYVYQRYGELVRSYGMFPNERMSICTSPSSNRSSLSNEAVRGYLEDYDEKEDLRFLEE